MGNLFANCTVAVENVYVEDGSLDEDIPDGGGVIIVGPVVGATEVDGISTNPPFYYK